MSALVTRRTVIGNTLATRRAFLLSAGLGAVGLAALAACGEGASPATAPSSAAGAETSAAPGAYGPLSLQLSWIKNIEFAGEYVADKSGYYSAAGLGAVDLVTGPVDSADALVAAGSIDIGVSAPDSTARYIVEQGAPLMIIGSTYQKNPFCILSLEEGKPIRTLADLAGKTIGIQAGTNQAIFDGLCKANNVDTSTFETTVVQFEPTPLTEKKVDGFMAFLTNEPFLVEAAGFTPVTLAFADNGLPLTSETFCVQRSMIEQNRDKLKAFLKAEVQGWNDVIRDPEAATRLTVEEYGKNLGLKYEGQLQQLRAQNALILTPDTKAHGLLTSTDEAVAKVISALASMGITISAEELFDLSLINEVFDENPDLILG